MQIISTRWRDWRNMLTENLYQKPMGGCRQMVFKGYQKLLEDRFQSPKNICRSRNFVNLLVCLFWLQTRSMWEQKKLKVIGVMNMLRSYWLLLCQSRENPYLGGGDWGGAGYFGKRKLREKWPEKRKLFKNQRQPAKEIEVLQSEIWKL